MLRHLLSVFAVCLAAAACDKTPPQPVVGPGAPETINGTERLGWSQQASDTAELATFHYEIYVDGTRSELSGASCSRSSATDIFACSAPLPRLTAGAHTIELATAIVDGALFESARSGSFRVNVTPTLTTSIGGSSSSPAGAIANTTIVTKDGVRLRLSPVVTGVVEPTDLAFAPDGRIFVAERGGRLRIVRDGRMLSEPAVDLAANGIEHYLIALAIDPGFERTHVVYLVYTSPSRAGGRTFTLARFREAANTLGSRIVLRDEIPASNIDVSASLRVADDGTLFVAFDDAGVPTSRGDLASANGKVLRLNGDGTTPDDQAGASPMYAYGYHSPRGLDWQPSGTLWIADRTATETGRLQAVVTSDAARQRGIVRASFSLPPDTIPSAIAAYRSPAIPALQNSLLVASEMGRHVLRVQLDPHNPARVVSTERLLQDVIGGVRVVAVSPDGAIFVATSHEVGKLVMDR